MTGSQQILVLCYSPYINSISDGTESEMLIIVFVIMQLYKDTGEMAKLQKDRQNGDMGYSC